MTSNLNSATNRDSFLARLKECGLLTDDICEALNGSEAGSDAESAARLLVRIGRLTPFQAEAVLKGRTNELRIGNYDVLAQLGKGGMGTVFKARHRRMKRIVALKVLSREVADNPSFVLRFQREVETIAQLSHPNVVMAFDADEAEVGHFLVMEFVNGCDLASEVQLNGALSVADAVEYTIQAATGLEYAHSRGIIHRDIKPANLMRDEAGVIKVADMGLARLAVQGSDSGVGSLTQAGGIVGTTEYMPPEQAMDSTAIDLRADVYSLGCTLYYLLTAKPPYQANSLMALLLKHRDAPIPSLCASRADVPTSLEAVFARAVAKKPEDRYQTMTEFVQALQVVRQAEKLTETRPSSGMPQGVGSVSGTDMTVAADSAQMLAVQQDTRTASSSSSMVGATVGAAPTPSEAGRVRNLVVALVEPSRVQAQIIRKYLQQLGIEQVEVLNSGAQALDAMKAMTVNVVLSSMHLKDLTGVQLLQALRGEGSTAGFVLITSELDEEQAGLLQAGRGVLLMKPFDLRTLTQAMGEASRG